MDFIMLQMIYVLRILLAALCGGLVGYERQNRKKTAGIRTHLIIAVASAMMMIISKYGFNDVLGEYIRLDPSRVAAGIVTAIGFIGSGIILFKNNSVSGITTSAGIWATVGLGMSMGAGMYALGVVATIIIMLAEMFLGRKGWFYKKNGDEKEIEIDFCDDTNGEIYEFIRMELETCSYRLENIQLSEDESGCIFSAQIKAIPDADIMKLAGELKKKEGIRKVSIQ